MHIYYIDDDIEDIEIFGDALKDIIAAIGKDIHYHPVTDLQLLRTLIESTAPAHRIIFLDVNMPGKTGIDILTEIKGDHFLKDTPVVMYSTSSDDIVIQRSKNLGASLYAVKPGKFRLIRQVINDILEIDWPNHKADGKDFLLKY